MANAKNRERGILQSNLWKLRVLNGYTQVELAERIGKSPGAYSKKELGNQNFTIEELRILADLYKVSMDDLTGKELMVTK